MELQMIGREKMKTSLLAVAVMSAMPLAMVAPAAHAVTRSPLLDLGQDQLRGEVQTRYDAALAATRADDVRRSDDTRYTWASEAKVQCGIAIGFLKSGTVDEDSVNRCDAFSARMSMAPPPVMPPPPAAAANCPSELKAIVFFDWNVDVPLPEASGTIAQIVDQRAACGWSKFSVVGHTDKSGTDIYNNGLSTRRAANIAAMMEQSGIAAGDIATEARGESQVLVETADGVREAQNRRVEVTAVTGGLGLGGQ
jgi:outer membrane protein OmpA-like peptidoglycan-associated protein